MKIKQKKGISLIVLVITIVVMIILATVVILSLDSSNMIERANEAKAATNLANLKEAASVALAEYKLEVSLGNIDENAVSANDYVKNKLEEQGMDASTMAISKDGKVMTGLSKVAAQFVGEGVEVGVAVTGYDLSGNTKTTYATTGNENTAPTHTETTPTTQNIARASTLNWKYMGISEEGEALIVIDATSSMPTMLLSGKGGYLNGPSELDLACDTLYSSDMGKARSINYEDVIGLLEYKGPIAEYFDKTYNIKYLNDKKTIGELTSLGEIALTYTSTPDGKDLNSYYADAITINKSSADIFAQETAQSLVFQNTEYWLATSCVSAHSFPWECSNFSICTVYNTQVRYAPMFYSTGDSQGYTKYVVRPVVELNSDVDISYNGVSVTLSK